MRRARGLPFIVVPGLCDITYVRHQSDVPRPVILFDPFSLLKKAGPLIANARPVLLGFPMPRIRVALGVGQDDQREEIFRYKAFYFVGMG